jgi:ABC-type Zn2+ transport system substrate-binding protein/surface adhesin
LTTTYETIAYHIHCSSSRRWLDDVMRQQEGDDDDEQHDVQLHRRDHEEGHGREKRDEHEEDCHHQEDLDQEDDGRGCLVVYFSSSFSITFTCSVTARLAAPPPGTTIQRGRPIDGCSS